MNRDEPELESAWPIWTAGITLAVLFTAWIWFGADLLRWIGAL